MPAALAFFGLLSLGIVLGGKASASSEETVPSPDDVPFAPNYLVLAKEAAVKLLAGMRRLTQAEVEPLREAIVSSSSTLMKVKTGQVFVTRPIAGDPSVFLAVNAGNAEVWKRG